MDKPKNVYYISVDKKDTFYNQLAWAEDVFKQEHHYVFNSDNKIFRSKEIYAYNRKIDQISGNHLLGHCIILADSGKFDSKVMICPIYSKSEAENKAGINIGRLYQLKDDEDYIAALPEIRFVSKARFKVNNNDSNAKQSNSTEYLNYGAIQTSSFLLVLDCYRKFIQGLIEKTRKITKSMFTQSEILCA